jgi:hypothetical protein
MLKWGTVNGRLENQDKKMENASKELALENKKMMWRKRSRLSHNIASPVTTDSTRISVGTPRNESKQSTHTPNTLKASARTPNKRRTLLNVAVGKLIASGKQAPPLIFLLP